MILAKNVTLEEGYKINRNVLVLGVPGSGKSRGHVLPNLMEMDGSFLILDPKGELYRTAAGMLRRRGYSVRCLDFEDPMCSPDTYNPLMHIHSDDDILRLSELLVEPLRATCIDPFWAQSAQILANSLIDYLRLECDPEDRTLAGVMKLLRVATNGGE